MKAIVLPSEAIVAAAVVLAEREGRERPGRQDMLTAQAMLLAAWGPVYGLALFAAADMLDDIAPIYAEADDVFVARVARAVREFSRNPPAPGSPFASS